MEAKAKHPHLCAYQGLHWPHTKVLLKVLLIFSAWLFPGLAWCPQMYTFRHDGSLLPRCSASYLTNVAVSAQHNSPKRAHLSPSQVSIRVRQQKPNWHRKVNAHGWVLTFIFKPHTVSKPAETASGNSVHWPLCPHHGPGAGCTSTDVLALVRVLGCGSDNEETCLSYSSLGRSSCVFNMKHFTVKSNPKTSWIQSSHTLSMTLFGTE